MNQTRSNSSIFPIECQHLRRLFQHYSIDILILQIYYTFTALAIGASNSALLHKLFKKRHKTRADKMFIILSCSDIGVGLVSVPMMSLPLFIKNFQALCQLSPILKFLNYIPYGFSWFLITLIALDRVLLVTKGYVYKKYVTIKHLYWITTMGLLLSLAVAMKVATEGEFLKGNSFVARCIHISFEMCFTIITIVAYMYLFYFARSKSRKMSNARRSGINFDRKLMMTITYTYICLLLFTIPYFIRDVVSFIFPISDLEIERNVRYWVKILVFSNSYANAFIILHNSRWKLREMFKLQPNFREKKNIKERILSINFNFRFSNFLILIKSKRNDKRFNNRAYSLFFLMAIFLKYLWLIPNILKWQERKIFTKLVPLQTPSRSSHRRCSVKKGALKNLWNFTGKHLCCRPLGLQLY